MDPALVSEHLCWSGIGGRHFNDLLPLPYTDEALSHVCARVTEVQDRLRREIAVENVSSYLAFADATISEWEFVAEVVRRTGCKLVLDVNNIYVNAVNHGFDADAYLAAIAPDAVAEIHLAGFDATGPCLVDTHGARVAPRRLGAVPHGDRAVRATADADRVGRRHSRVRGARRGSRDRAGGDRSAPCPRCVSCSSGLPTRCFAGDEAPPAFACADPATGAERLAIYRRTVRANYRNALGATFPVVQRLVGTPFFNAAVDAFARARPSRSGDLNEYGDAFGDFLAGYPPAAGLAYLADVARLEWAIDEANRAPDSTVAPDIVLGALAVFPADQLPESRLRIEPSCRLVASEFPLLRIWQVNQPDHGGDLRVAFDAGPDHLRIRREPDGIALERIAAGEFAWLAALSRRGLAGRGDRPRPGRRRHVRSRRGAASVHRRRHDRRRRRASMTGMRGRRD